MAVVGLELLQFDFLYIPLELSISQGSGLHEIHSR